MIGSAAAAVLLTWGTWWVARGDAADRIGSSIPGERPGPTVEVLNATTVDGLARDVTRALRGRGIDVVYYGSAARDDLDSTVVLARRGGTAAAWEVRDALGFGGVENAPAPQLLLEVTVMLGRDAGPADSSTHN